MVLVEGARPGAEFILARRYQVASLLEFMLPGQPRVECCNQGQRGNQWDLWSSLHEREGQTALYIDYRKMPPEVRERFGQVEPIISPLILGHPERPIKRWYLYQGRGWKVSE